MSQIRAILWDIDGTLMDFALAERNALQQTFQEFGLPAYSEELRQEYSLINKRYWTAMELGKITKPQVLVGRFQELFEIYGIDIALAEEFNTVFQLHIGDEVHFFPNAMELVQDFKSRGYLQCAVTNGTKLAQDRKLVKSGLNRILDYVFISEDVGFEKPSADFFRTVFRSIGHYQPDEAIIVGDSLTSDIQGGKNAGIRTCWFNPQGMVQNLDIQPDFEIRKLAELKRILRPAGA